jgi:hypothetical protein
MTINHIETTKAGRRLAIQEICEDAHSQRLICMALSEPLDPYLAPEVREMVEAGL